MVLLNPQIRRSALGQPCDSKSPASCIHEWCRVFAVRSLLMIRNSRDGRCIRQCTSNGASLPMVDRETLLCMSDRSQLTRTNPTVRAFRRHVLVCLDTRETHPTASERPPMPRSADDPDEHARHVITLLRASGAPDNECQRDPACTPPTKAGTSSC